MAGLELTLTPAARGQRRAAGQRQGSVTTAGIVEELSALAAAIAAGSFAVHPKPVPLAEAESVWDLRVAPGECVVLVP